MGPDDSYLLQYSKDVRSFWADPRALALGACFRPRGAGRPAAPLGRLVDEVPPAWGSWQRTCWLRIQLTQRCRGDRETGHKEQAECLVCLCVWRLLSRSSAWSLRYGLGAFDRGGSRQRDGL